MDTNVGKVDTEERAFGTLELERNAVRKPMIAAIHVPSDRHHWGYLGQIVQEAMGADVARMQDHIGCFAHDSHDRPGVGTAVTVRDHC